MVTQILFDIIRKAMRCLVILVMGVGLFAISNGALASTNTVKQKLPQTTDAKVESPAPLKPEISAKDAMNAVAEGVSFVEVSESDLLLMLDVAAPGFMLCDSLHKGCKPELNKNEPAGCGKQYLRIL